ncbi:hypothetical protein [Streptomyces sp. NPDC047525]
MALWNVTYRPDTVGRVRSVQLVTRGFAQGWFRREAGVLVSLGVREDDG